MIIALFTIIGFCLTQLLFIPLLINLVISIKNKTLNEYLKVAKKEIANTTIYISLVYLIMSFFGLVGAGTLTPLIAFVIISLLLITNIIATISIKIDIEKEVENGK